VPVLAELHDSPGGQFVALAERLNASRDAIRQALNTLIDAGIVMRDPSATRSDRPEYVITAEGAPVARAAANLMKELRDRKTGPIALRKWGMTIVFVLGLGRTRFNEIRAVLPAVSPRALALALKDLQSHGLIERTVTETYPPATAYTLTDRSTPLFPALMDLFVVTSEYLRGHKTAPAIDRARPPVPSP